MRVKMRSPAGRALSLALALCLLLSLTACGGGEGSGSAGTASATTMRLMRTEGSVEVLDGDRTALDLVKEMLLYSGYQVSTRAESYGWIDLDDTKLTKLDERSEAEVTQDGRALRIEVSQGRLFFHITEPLEDGEALTICSSTMTTAIRGTCGWAWAEDGEHMSVYILEGTVECSVTVPESGEVITLPVSAGEAARLTSSEEEDSGINIRVLESADVPGFVLDEAEEDEDLAAAIRALADRDLPEDGGAGDGESLSDVERALRQYRSVVAQADSYEFSVKLAPKGECQYTVEQMNKEDTVPVLFLKKDFEDSRSEVLVFRYDPDTDTAHQAAGSVIVGEQDGLGMEEDGNGIWHIENSSGNGECSIYRYTLSGDVLKREFQWSGIFGQQPAECDSRSIGDWHDVGDTSGLNSWTPVYPLPVGTADGQTQG